MGKIEKIARVFEPLQQRHGWSNGPDSYRKRELESKQDSMQWHIKGSAPPKKFEVSQSVGKIMAIIFWDTERILLIVFKEKNISIMG